MVSRGKSSSAGTPASRRTTRTEAEAPPPPDFTRKVYDAITAVFGSGNPTQLFCLHWPGTLLDHERLDWDPSEEIAGNMSERALVRISQILDRYVPPAPITQPDGTRVSDRYRNAITQLGPVPDKALIRLQELVREQLKKPVTVIDDGHERVTTLADWFERLYQAWARAKGEWGAMQQRMIVEFRRDHPLDARAAWDDYLRWYGQNAAGFIATVDAAYERLIAEFPLETWYDALTILDTSASRQLKEAKDLVRNLRTPVPYQEGVDYLPTFGIPYSWPRELRPSTKFLDLLADPETQFVTWQAALTALEAEVDAWRAILPQVDDETVAAAAEAFATAMTTYSTAWSDVRGTYTDNLIIAAKIFIDVYAGKGASLGDIGPADQEAAVKEVDDLAETLDADEGTPARGAKKAEFATYEELKKFVDEVGAGQKNLEGKQAAATSAGLELAGAARKFLEAEGRSSRLKWVDGYVSQLESKIARLQDVQRDLASASSVYGGYLPAGGDAPNRSKDFALTAEPSPLDWPDQSRWTRVTVSVTTEEIQSAESLVTSFTNEQWGVNFFLASGGGTNSRDGSTFVTDYMANGGQVTLSFLCAKVLVDRPWMKPEVLAATSQYFRVGGTPMTRDTQVTADQLLGSGAEKTVEDLVHGCSFPAYPIALLVAKDISVRVTFDAAKTTRMREHSRAMRSEGGGFLFFSYARTDQTSAQDESVNSYVMGGQLVVRVPAPQVIGSWVQLLPPDQSTKLDEKLVEEIMQAVGFAQRLGDAYALGSGAGSVDTPPVEPDDDWDEDAGPVLRDETWWNG